MLKQVIKYGKKSYLFIFLGWCFLILFFGEILKMCFPQANNIVYFQLLQYVGVIFFFLPNYQLKHFYDDLTKRCDLEAFNKKANNYYKLIQFQYNKHNNRYIPFFLQAMATSMMLSENYSKANELYEVLQNNPNFINKQSLYYDLSVISLRLDNNLEKAKYYLQCEEEYYNTNGNIYNNSLITSLLYSKINIYIYEENYFEAKQLLLQLEESENSHNSFLIQKVQYNYKMGLIEYNLCNYNNSLTYLQYVVDNGNTILLKTKAEELIEKISKEAVKQN